MKHSASTHRFGRKQGPRKALIRGLVDALVEHERIRTTAAKAKELRRHVEKAITIGKGESLHARRLLLEKFPNKTTVDKIVTNLSKRFKTRPGGYTRIIRAGARPGDQADMALIEFVDYVLPTQSGDETVKGDNESKKRTRALGRDTARARKHVRAIQVESRRTNRH